MSVEELLAWNRLAGSYYGSEDQSIFFYSLCKMQRPETVLELGTGLGHTAFWMAQAIKENGTGHVWTVDNGARWPDAARFVASLGSEAAKLVGSFPSFSRVLEPSVLTRAARQTDQPGAGSIEWMESFARVLGLSDAVSFLAGTMSLTETTPLRADTGGLPSQVLKRPIDLLYADFDHYPHAILVLLAKFLPQMSECSSIFVDSAATYLPSYLVLQQTIDQLNRGKVPAIFLAGSSPEQRDQIAEIIATRQFTLLTLPELKDRNQNGLAWIRIEPVNVFPYPLTQMRGLFAAPVAGSALASLFSTGSLPQEHVKRWFLFEQFMRAAYPLSEAELSLLLSLMAGRKPASSQ
jgi:hypothetical protein